MSSCAVCDADERAKECRHCGVVVCEDHWLPAQHGCDGASEEDPSTGRRSLPEPDRGESRLGMWLVLGAVVLFGLAFVGGGFDDPAEFEPSVVEEAAIERINEVRTANGVPALEQSATLAENARSWSRTMAYQGELSHADTSAYACRRGGENILYSYWRTEIDTERGTKYFGDSEALGRGIANQWLNSSQHRENILRESFDATGIGVYMPESDGGNRRVYATQRFCG